MPTHADRLDPNLPAWQALPVLRDALAKQINYEDIELRTDPAGTSKIQVLDHRCDHAENDKTVAALEKLFQGIEGVTVNWDNYGAELRAETDEALSEGVYAAANRIYRAKKEEIELN